MSKALIKSIGVYQILAVKNKFQACIMLSKCVKLLQINISGSVSGFNKYQLFLTDEMKQYVAVAQIHNTHRKLHI